MKRALFLFLMAVIIPGCRDNGGGGRREAAVTQTPQAGSPATDFLYRDMNDRPFRLSDKKGKVVMLFFWRLKCDDCLPTMRSLDALHRKYRDRGLIAVALNEDSMHSGEIEKVKSFLEKERVTFINMRDDQGYVSEAFSVISAPRTIVVGKDGVIAAIKDGRTDWMSPENDLFVESLLNR